MGEEASLKNMYRRYILDVLEEACQALSFKELVSVLEKIVGQKVNRFIVREVLGELVREGRVKRRPDYERRLMVFEIPCSKG